MLAKRALLSFLIVAQSLTLAITAHAGPEKPFIPPEYKTCVQMAVSKAKPAGTVAEDMKTNDKTYTVEANSIYNPELNGDDPITRSLKISLQANGNNKIDIVIAATYGNRVGDDPKTSQEVVRYVTKGTHNAGKSSVEEGLAYAPNSVEPPYATQLEVTSRGDKAMRYTMDCLAQIISRPAPPSPIAQNASLKTTRTP